MIILMVLRLRPAISLMDAVLQTALCLQAAVGLVVSVDIPQAVGNFLKNCRYVTNYQILASVNSS
jgi:hypothetical protein